MSTPDADRPSVLIVEDDRSLADLYARWLGQTYRTETAYSGTEALELIDETVDVVLLDRMMPGLTGGEVLAEIRASDASPRVVVVSAVTPDLDIVSMGFDAYLEKPVDAATLEEMVERMLTRAEYDEKLRELFSLIERQDTLEAVKDPEVLEGSEEYRELTERLEGAQTDVESLLTDLPDDDFRVAVERLQRTAAERVDERRYRSLTDDVLDSSREATIVVDADGTIVWANEATETLLGMNRDDVRGREYSAVAAEQYQDIQVGEESLASLVQANVDRHSEELDTIVQLPATSDAGARWLDYWSGPIETGLYAGGWIEHFHDITDRYTREQQLRSLHRATREMIAAESEDAVVEQAVSTATSDLGFSYAGIFRRAEDTGELVPQADRQVDQGSSIDPPTISGGSDPVWTVFTDQVDVLDRTTYRSSHVRETWLDEVFDDWLLCSLAQQGVFVLATTGEDLAAADYDLAKIWAANTRQSLARLQRNRDLKRRDRKLKRKNERLSRLDRINQLIRSIGPSVVSADSREEIERIVCQRLTRLDRVAGAWFAEVDVSTDRTVPRAWAGRLDEYLSGLTDDATEGADGEPDTHRGPARRAYERGASVLVEDLLDVDVDTWWRARALNRGVHTIVAVPIRYRSSSVGALEVHIDRPQGLHTEEVEALEELGVTIGHAIGAIRQRNALLSGGSVTLEFRIRTDPTLSQLANRVSGQLRIRDVSYGSDGVCTVFAYAENDGDAEDAGAGQATLPERSASILREGSVYQVELAHDSPIPRMVEHGATLTDVELLPDSGETAVSVSLPHDVVVRDYVETITGIDEPVELIAKRENSGDGDSLRGTIRLGERLTDRQREVLQVAFHAGYFDWPRQVNAETVAEAIGIAQSTFSQHLRASELKLLEELFAGDTVHNHVSR
ncbi:MAG: helix-turn-helix domain-containing protein [Halobellus sp.]|uniref:helix-turn-helix domain-containing protein n=1 Tax=Halobellus sp. TaxID=1979212 RepID=UPI0035D4F12A